MTGGNCSRPEEDMMNAQTAMLVNSVEQLESIYGEPMPTSLAKEIDHINRTAIAS